MCLCVSGKTTQGCSGCYLEALTGLTLRFHGWLGSVFVFVCVCSSSKRRERCSSWLKKEIHKDYSLPPQDSHLHQQDTGRQTQEMFAICCCAHTHRFKDKQAQFQLNKSKNMIKVQIFHLEINTQNMHK